MQTTSSAVFWTGHIALLVTLVYTTAGMGSQAWKIVRTGQTPGMCMMLLCGLTFLSWCLWAWQKEPREVQVLVANSTGLLMAIVIISLSFWSQCHRERGVSKSSQTEQERTKELRTKESQ